MEYIHSDERLEALAGQLSGAGLLAIDTEAAGYHRYHDRICLFQVSTRTDTWVIDTLAVSDIAPLTPLLASDAVEVVLHDADYDLRLLARDYGVRITHLFDTKLAAQLLGEPQIGLASLLEKHVGVKLDKKHQRADWAQRPLPRDMIAYAAEDTKHLPELRDVLRRLLEQTGRLHWAHEEFELRVQVDAAAASSDPDAWLRLKNTRDLKPRQLAALRELHGWREATAAERDVAPFRVIGNETLVEIARRLPEQVDQLRGIPGLSDALIRRRGAAVMDAVARARALPERELPVRPRGPGRPPPDPSFDACVERLKAVRDRAAERLGLERGFLMPRQQLEDVARARPRTPAALRDVRDMRAWQVEALGAELIEALVEC
ncbi:MAG TPA: HRDC domain-containing protein [Longimicrobiales bacterium]|nr:HRDC domain-containing protein [Longimicrobiales bacterium]